MIRIAIVSFLVSFAIGPAAAQDFRNSEQLADAGFKRYDAEFGTIVFEVSGSGARHIIYFDRWGWREVTSTSSQLQVLDGEYFTNCSVPNAKGTKVRTNEQTKRLSGDASKSLAELDRMAALAGGGIEAGKERILGKTCQILEFPDQQTKLWLWNGITLKKEQVTNSGTITTTAVEVDFKHPPDVSALTVPQHFKIMDIGAIPNRQ